MTRFLPLRPLAFALTLAPGLALADPVSIPGPLGPLAGEALAVPGAAHAVVIIPGSGPIDRDGNGPAGTPGAHSDSYRLLAEGLAAAGIASIRIDKRGSFASTEAVDGLAGISVAGYAEDARGWVAEAAGLAPCVWLAGHSEGGLVALVTAQEPPEALCGLILLATPGRPTGQLLREQIAAQPGTKSLMPDVERLTAAMEHGRHVPAEEVPDALASLFQPAIQPYLIDLFSHDPAALAASWHGPALIVEGGADVQVMPQDGAALAAALPQAQRLTLPDATHMLKAEVPGAPYATYTDPSLPLHPDLVPGIAAFLAGQTP